MTHTIRDREIGCTFDVPAEGEVTVGEAATTGREIRLNAAGKFLSQPWNDNYWTEYDTYSAAVDAAERPE